MGDLSEYSRRFLRSITDLYNFTFGRLFASFLRAPSRIVFLGIDNAGKTTLVYKLKNNTNNVFLPTKHATEDQVEIGNLKALIVDVGGHQAARVAWKDYFHRVDGVVFLVDVADRERHHEVAEAWAAMLDLEREAPIIVLMNKIDKLREVGDDLRVDPATAQSLESSIGISRVGSPNQSIEIMYISLLAENAACKDSSLTKAFAWLGAKINERKEQAKAAH